MKDSDGIYVKHPGLVNGFVRPVRVPGSNYWTDGKRRWTAKEINEKFGPIRTRYGPMYAKEDDA